MPPGDLGDLDFYIGGKSLPDEKTPTNGITGMRECSSNPFCVESRGRGSKIEGQKEFRDRLIGG